MTSSPEPPPSAPPRTPWLRTAHGALCLLGPGASAAAFWYAPLAWYASPHLMPAMVLLGLFAWASAQCLALCLTWDLWREEPGFQGSPVGVLIASYWLVGGLSLLALFSHLEAAAQVWSLGGWIVTAIAVAMPIGDRLRRPRAASPGANR